MLAREYHRKGLLLQCERQRIELSRHTISETISAGSSTANSMIWVLDFGARRLAHRKTIGCLAGRRFLQYKVPVDVLDGEKLLAFHLTDRLMHHLVHGLATGWIEGVRISLQAHHDCTDQRVYSIR